MKRSLTALFVLMLSVVGLPSYAEKITDEQVLKAFDQYMAAMKEGDFAALADFMHPGELEAFKKLFVTIGESAQKEGNFAEFGGVFRVETLNDLRVMPPKQMFANLFVVLTQMMPQFKEILQSAEVTLLGQVTEGEGEDELLHLVFRMEMVVNDAKVTSVDTSAMKKGADGRYYFLLGEEVQGLVNALKNQFGGVN